jgi:hypothetical protein
MRKELTGLALFAISCLLIGLAYLFRNRGPIEPIVGAIFLLAGAVLITGHEVVKAIEKRK